MKQVDARHDIIREWRSLPKELRQTDEQAEAFAMQIKDKYKFSSDTADPYQTVRGSRTGGGSPRPSCYPRSGFLVGIVEFKLLACGAAIDNVLSRRPNVRFCHREQTSPSTDAKSVSCH